MGSNKKRLYVALYPSGVVNNEERRYHWGFLIGPKEEKEKVVPGERYHVKNDPRGRWVFEALRLENVRSTATLLVRVVIAKIADERRLIQLLRQVPVVQDDPEWRCRTWVAQALRAIERDGHCVSSAVLDWPIIEAKAREYAAAKAAAGRYGLGKDMLAPKPTYDILERRETVP
ncbi:hypothetical protein PGQ11_002618 [Apiospora arundinis]|uniref:Uncharacterized protein n=1 Tax=Apiospora arundinis TaxID=335852 RepID=A0ABR2JK58_9PEZI